MRSKKRSQLCVNLIVCFSFGRHKRYSIVEVISKRNGLSQAHQSTRARSRSLHTRKYAHAWHNLCHWQKNIIASQTIIEVKEVESVFISVNLVYYTHTNTRTQLTKSHIVLLLLATAHIKCEGKPMYQQTNWINLMYERAEDILPKPHLHAITDIPKHFDSQIMSNFNILIMHVEAQNVRFFVLILWFVRCGEWHRFQYFSCWIEWNWIDDTYTCTFRQQKRHIHIHIGAKQ